jgi:hypothetical protein
MITRSSVAAAALAATLFSSVAAHAAESSAFSWFNTPDWFVFSAKWDYSKSASGNNDAVSQDCNLDYRPSFGRPSFGLQEDDKGALKLYYHEHGVKWTGPVSMTLQIDDNAPWSGQVIPHKKREYESDNASFSSVYMPIQRPLMDEFRHGRQAKFTVNGSTQVISLSDPVAELAFTEMDHCVASIKAERLARWPLQKRAPAAPSTGSR